MSFVDFNYDIPINYLNNRISLLNDQLTEYGNKLVLLESTPYVSILADEINAINNMINQLNNEKIMINAVLIEINRIQNLSVEDKALLYYFYTIVEDTQTNFMRKLLFNTTESLHDPTIQALLTDVTTPNEAKAIVAKIIYQKYIINQEYYMPIILAFNSMN